MSLDFTVILAGASVPVALVEGESLEACKELFAVWPGRSPTPKSRRVNNLPPDALRQLAGMATSPTSHRLFFAASAGAVPAPNLCVYTPLYVHISTFRTLDGP